MKMKQLMSYSNKLIKGNRMKAFLVCLMYISCLRTFFLSGGGGALQHNAVSRQGYARRTFYRGKYASANRNSYMYAAALSDYGASFICSRLLVHAALF